MGQSQNKNPNQDILQNLHQKFIVQTNIPESNTKILKSRQNSSFFLMKQISMTSTEDFNKFVQKIKRRKNLKHQHYLSIQQYYAKSQNSFCSTFHRVSLIYQYSNHSLQNQIDARLAENRKFEQKQIWSIMCSCSLALAYLFRNNITFSVLNPSQIFLTSEGVVKLIDPQISTTSINGMIIRQNQYYSPQYLRSSLLKQSNKGCIFSLGMCLLHVMLLEPMFECYSYEDICLKENKISQKIIKLKQNCFSEALINVIQKMTLINQNQRFGILDLELYLFKLIDQNIDPLGQQSRRHSGEIQQKQINQIQLQKQIISTILEPLKPDIQQKIGEEDMIFQQDNQNPDQSDQKQQQIITERSNFMATQKYTKITQQKQKQYVINSKFKQKRQEQLNKKKQVKYDEIENNKKLQTPKLQNTDQKKDKEKIFTDPKLMDMLKKDLEVINLKRSKILNSNEESRLRFSRNQFSRNSIIQQSLNSSKKNVFDQSTKNINKLLPMQKKSKTSQNPLEQIINTQNYQDYQIKQNNQNGFTKKKNQNQAQGLRYVNQIFSRGRYQGQKLGNYRHGYGTFYYKQGGKYTGYWNENKMHGKGTLYYSNNKIAYEGDWREDRLWGYGVLYNQQPKILQESYNYNSWNEIDEYWIKYEGSFEEDNKSGKGKLYLTNKQIFQGIFIDDQVNGQGIFYKIDGQVVKGIWKQNLLVKYL